MKKYKRQYELLKSWLNKNNVNKIFKNVLLAYFLEKVKVLQSWTTLESIYSIKKKSQHFYNVQQ